MATAVFFGVARLAWPGLGGRAAMFGFVLLTIVIITSVAAAHARAQFGFLEAANKKYASFAALGWLGFMTVLCGVSRDLFQQARKPEIFVVSILSVIFLGFSLHAWSYEPRIWSKYINMNWEAALAVFTKSDVQLALDNLYTDQGQLADYVADIEKGNRSIFSYFPFHYGDDVTALLASGHEVGCRSEVQSFAPVANADLSKTFQVPGRPFTFSGWTWMTKERAVPETIIAVNGRNRIIGVARVTRTSARMEEWLGQTFYGNHGWFGYARVQDTPEASFIAFGAQYRSFCRLGGVGNVRLN